MPSRARIRVGAFVAYSPTAVEVTANGLGPWPAQIVEVKTTGLCDLIVFAPDATTLGAAVTDPLTTSANATTIAAPATLAFTDPPSAAEMGLLRTLVNELRTNAIALTTLANESKADTNTLVTRLNQLVSGTSGLRKADVQRGSTAGTFSLVALARTA